jgi:hypothetical protein
MKSNIAHIYVYFVCVSCIYKNRLNRSTSSNVYVYIENSLRVEHRSERKAARLDIASVGEKF